MSISDIGVLSIASITPAAFLAQAAPGPMQYSEYGIVGVTVALALWSLRDAQQRRIDDAKEYASDIKQLLVEARTDSTRHHELQVALLSRLLDGHNAARDKE
jgi:hypothetical protein